MLPCFDCLADGPERKIPIGTVNQYPGTFLYLAGEDLPGKRVKNIPLDNPL